ncbi:DUF3592 domain-containing protein (plasmid) [Streptomyces sp. BI20]|uniref:DUF3592 domain-containing protein n=1 Tax=Streptomyces sp. BI20 TaxID=3403460 RepID=UPI003C715255
MSVRNEASEGTGAAEDAVVTAPSGAGVGADVLVRLVVGLLASAAAVALFLHGGHLNSLRDGTLAPAVMRSGGTCVLGHCRVAFHDTDGREVVADLAAGSGGSKLRAGDEVNVRYRPGNPQEVALASDADFGSGMMTLGGLLGAAGIAALAASAVSALRGPRTRARARGER